MWSCWHRLTFCWPNHAIWIKIALVVKFWKIRCIMTTMTCVDQDYDIMAKFEYAIKFCKFSCSVIMIPDVDFLLTKSSIVSLVCYVNLKMVFFIEIRNLFVNKDMFFSNYESIPDLDHTSRPSPEDSIENIFQKQADAHPLPPATFPRISFLVVQWKNNYHKPTTPLDFIFGFMLKKWSVPGSRNHRGLHFPFHVEKNFHRVAKSPWPHYGYQFLFQFLKIIYHNVTSPATPPMSPALSGERPQAVWKMRQTFDSCDLVETTTVNGTELVT